MARYRRPIPNLDPIETETEIDGTTMHLSTVRRNSGLWVCSRCGMSSWGPTDTAPGCPHPHDDDGVQR